MLNFDKNLWECEELSAKKIFLQTGKKTERRNVEQLFARATNNRFDRMHCRTMIVVFALTLVSPGSVET